MRLAPSLPPRRRRPARPTRALTLLEVMMVVAIVSVLIALVAPSMREMVGMQRLRSVTAQIVTDVQFARSESISRHQVLGFNVRNNPGEPMSCYVLFTSNVDPLNVSSLDATQCNCTSPPGGACGGTQREVRVGQIGRDLGMQLRLPASQPRTFAYNPVNGGIGAVVASSSEIGDRDFCLEVTRQPRGRLRVTINVAGRPSVCSPDLSVPGFDGCPAPDDTLKNCLGIPAP